MPQYDIKILLDACRFRDELATTEVWEEFFPRLSLFARRKLPSRARVVCDEEDVASMALERLFAGLAKGSFRGIQSYDELWALLATMTKHQASHARRASQRSPVQWSASGGKPISVLPTAAVESQPVDVVSYEETVGRLLSLLDEELRDIVQLRLAGCTISEIATAEGSSTSAVHRKLIKVRKRALPLFDG